jgi:hypothetical protein
VGVRVSGGDFEREREKRKGEERDIVRKRRREKGGGR